jgi:hypothetical protein
MQLEIPTVTFAEMLADCADPCGLLRANGTVANADAGFLARALQKRLRTGWRFYAWPSLTIVEERAFRPTYSMAANYALGDVVYDPDTDAYYEALQDGFSARAISDGAYWQPATEFAPYIELSGEGLSSIGEVLAVTNADPGVTRNPRRIDWTLSDYGVQFRSTGGLTKVWVQFRIPAPQFTTKLWTSGTYNRGDVRYYAPKGDCYLSLADGNTATPGATDDDSWERQIIPRFLHDYAVTAVHADWLRDEGQTDKAIEEESNAEDLLIAERNQFTRQQGIPQRYKVRLR